MAKKEELEAVADEATDGKARLAQAKEKFGEAAARAREGGAQLKQSAGKAGEAAREKVGVAVDNLKHGYDKVGKDMDKLVDDVNEYVRDNPGRSVLMAAGAGFLIGLLLRGRRH